MTTSPLTATAEPSAGGTSGLGTFMTLWSGQVVSVLGSTMSGFALGVWVFQTSGSATAYSLLVLATVAPGILLAPLAGQLADRLDRRRLLIAADAGAAAATAVLALLAWRGSLEVWHVYLVAAGGACFNALQMPAFSASVPLLVAKRHLGQTAGMTQLGHALPQVVAPLAAAGVLLALGLGGVLLVDLATFGLALATFAVVRIPRPPATAEEERDDAAEGRDLLFGWRYLRRRPGLLALLLLFAVVNFCLGSVQALLTPLVLSFTDAGGLGVVLSASGVGLVAGALATSALGVPRRRVRAILLAVALQGCVLFLAALRPSTWLVAGAAFTFICLFPLVASCSTTIWQTKVAPAVQGRVFGFQRAVAAGALPLAFLTVGPLADRVFEPLLQPGGGWADSIGRLVGVGPGRGIAVMLLALGVVVLLAVAIASRRPRLRRLEDELADAV